MSLDALKNSLPSIDSIKASVGMTPNLPKTYKVALFKKANEKLSVEDYELKMPEQGEILIKVLATGVCHSDAMSQAGIMGSQ